MFYMRSENSVTVVIDGKPYTVAHGHATFQALNDALDKLNFDKIRDVVTSHEKLNKILGKWGAVTVFGGHVTYNDQPLENYLVTKILHAKPSDIPVLSNFLDKVMLNPSFRATRDLYKWCEKANMPLAPDGRIIAYKIVNDDFTDCYTGKFDNSPGKIVQVARNQVDENPDKTCSHGLHFCSAEYLPHYGPHNKKVVLVAVSPVDVVAFPTDYNLSKARCCRYEVLQEIPAETAKDFFADYDDMTWSGDDSDDRGWVIQNVETEEYWDAEDARWTDDMSFATEYDSQVLPHDFAHHVQWVQV